MLTAALRRVALAAGVAALLVASPTAGAEPVPPPPDPAVLVPDPAIDTAAAALPAPNPFAANSQLTKDNPLAAFADILAQSSPAILLNPPPAPGTGAPVNPLAGVELLMPETYGMPTGDANSPYVLGEGNNGPFARINAFKGVHALAHAGLGRMPGVELGQPLPGTAPPPGTALPPGLVQFYPDPALLPPPPVPPLPPAPPAPPLPPAPPAPAG